MDGEVRKHPYDIEDHEIADLVEGVEEVQQLCFPAVQKIFVEWDMHSDADRQRAIRAAVESVANPVFLKVDIYQRMQLLKTAHPKIEDHIDDGLMDRASVVLGFIKRIKENPDRPDSYDKQLVEDFCTSWPMYYGMMRDIFTVSN